MVLHQGKGCWLKEIQFVHMSTTAQLVLQRGESGRIGQPSINLLSELGNCKLAYSSEFVQWDEKKTQNQHLR